MERGPRKGHECTDFYLSLPRDREDSTVLSCKECGQRRATTLRVFPLSPNGPFTLIFESTRNGYEPAKRAAQRAALLPARPRRHAVPRNRPQAGGRPRGEGDV